jgi:hypothetical protein
VLREPVAARQRGEALRAKAVLDHSWARAVEPLIEAYARLLGR